MMQWDSGHSMLSTRPRLPASRLAPIPARIRSHRASVTAHSRDSARWEVVHESLVAQDLKTISPAEAKRRVERGEWVIVDVRRDEQYSGSHAEGAVSVPIYKTITTNEEANPVKALKKILYNMNGVTPVDFNNHFDEQLQAATFGGKKPAVIMCEAGGTLVPSVNFPKGKSSRSLQAAYRGLKAGVKVAHMERGLYGWYNANLPMVGFYSPDVGRTPSAATAADPTLQQVAESWGYDVRDGDKKKDQQVARQQKRGWWSDWF